MGGFPKNETEVEVLDKRIIKRITVGNFFSNVLEAFNISRGGIYTAKRLLINPGQLAKDFIGVSRHRITPPINVLIISTALALILLSRIDMFNNLLADTLTIKINDPIQANMKTEVIHIFSSYFNLLLWIFIPFSAIFSYWFNRKRGLNFAENLVFQTYNLSLTNFIVIISFPLTYYSVEGALTFYQVIAFAYMVYGYKVFFGKKWIRSILETVAVFLIGSFLWSIAVAVFLILIVVYVAQ